MSYATPDQLDSLALPPDVSNAATAAEKQAALDAAAGMIDSYLVQAGFTTPLASAGQDVIEVEVSIAAWRLASSKGLAPENGERSNLYLRNRDALKWLAGVAEGKTVPTGASRKEDAQGYPAVASKPPRGW